MKELIQAMEEKNFSASDIYWFIELHLSDGLWILDPQRFIDEELYNEMLVQRQKECRERIDNALIMMRYEKHR